MTPNVRSLIPRKAVAATLAGVLALSSVAAAPARADGKEALAAAAILGIIAAGIISSTRQGSAYPAHQGTRKYLPNACRFHIKHGPNRGSWYDRGCLVSYDRDFRHLPDRCARWLNVRGKRHDLVAYRASCLVNNGPVVIRR